MTYIFFIDIDKGIRIKTAFSQNYKTEQGLLRKIEKLKKEDTHGEVWEYTDRRRFFNPEEKALYTF